MQISRVAIRKDLVLMGGGHAHVGVIKSFAMKPEPGVRVTLVSRDVHTPYSGMLPGLIAGHYEFDEAHIDLNALARFAGARFIHASAIGLDLVARKVLFADRPPLAFDVLSIDIGSSPSAHDVPGAREFAVGVKPISSFLQRWKALRERLCRADAPASIAVVGAGAAGVEVLLAMQWRLAALRAEAGFSAPLSFHLVSASQVVLPTFPAGVQRRFASILAERGVQVHAGARVSRIEAGRLWLGDTPLEADEIVWATAAAAAPWLRETGLALDAQGFVEVGDTLQSLSHEHVFAAGDIAAMTAYPRPKAGVFAVRQSAPLTRNLRLALNGRPLQGFTPQKEFLTLISSGDRHAIAARNGVSLEGDWVWRWKDRIDRAFMTKFNDLPVMDAGEEAMRCAGCGAKVGGAGLAAALGSLGPITQDDVVAGLADADDAAILRRADGDLDVQSVDFFPALVSDPYVFGQIASNHALGDIHAMGAQPRTAMAIAAIPHAEGVKMAQDLEQLMAGALKVLNAAGAALIGGHSAEGGDLAMGFALTGRVAPQRLLRKGGLQAGDALILVKPLGTGALFAADMRARAKGRWIEAAIAGMLQSNGAAADVFARFGAHAVTDVTGFGLAGHVLEMLRASQLDARIDLATVPLLDGAEECLAAGFASTAQPGNEAFAGPFVQMDAGVALSLAGILFDPQTAGGLLAGVPAGEAGACLVALRAAGYGQAAIIGGALARAGSDPLIRVEAGAGGAKS